VEDSNILYDIAYSYRQMGQFNPSINMLEEAILLGNEEIYLRASLIFNKYKSKIFNENNAIDELNKLLAKSDNYRDSVNTYDNLRSLYIGLGQVNRSYEYVERIRDLKLNKYGKLSSIKYLLNNKRINIFQHLDMMDSVKSFIDYYEESAIEPYDKTVAYKKCIYYLYMENYDMLSATIDDAESGYSEF